MVQCGFTIHTLVHLLTMLSCIPQSHRGLTGLSFLSQWLCVDSGSSRITVELETHGLQHSLPFPDLNF